MLKVYAARGQAESAAAFIEAMEDAGGPKSPNDDSWAHLVRALGNAGMLVDAEDIFEELGYQAPLPPKAARWAMLEVWARHGLVDRARSLLHAIRRAGEIPPQGQLALLVRAAGAAGDSVAAEAAVVDAMSDGEPPSPEVLAALVEACADAGDLPRAEGAVEAMLLRGHQ